MKRYIMIDWPETQKFQKEDGSYLPGIFTADYSHPLLFVPEDLYFDTLYPPKTRDNNDNPPKISKTIDEDLIIPELRDKFINKHFWHDIEYHSYNTGIGTYVKIVCKTCNKSEDITNYDCW